ncbi:hypothetical protein CGH75_14815, partial [Vibrio parahaemolyticus]|uniref:hypothetical protein n=1 Tax=Vibrio parahaemolyticus TaxID=670 RepID=UPI001174773B
NKGASAFAVIKMQRLTLPVDMPSFKLAALAVTQPKRRTQIKHVIPKLAPSFGGLEKVTHGIGRDGIHGAREGSHEVNTLLDNEKANNISKSTASKGIQK